MAAMRLRTSRLPALAAVARAQRDDERVGALVADEHDEIVHDDGGRAHAVDVVERPKWHPPPLASVVIVGKHTVLGEENVDAVFVDRRARRGWTVAGVELLL